MTDDQNWRTWAECTTVDPEIFYGTAADRQLARGVCSRCLVRRQCLADTLTMPARYREVGMVRGGRYFPKRHSKRQENTMPSEPIIHSEPLTPPRPPQQPTTTKPSK